MKRIGIIDVGFYKSRKDVEGDAASYNGVIARHGFCWFRYMPHFRTNGGRLSRREVLDVTIQWLCFGFNCTIWGNQ